MKTFTPDELKDVLAQHALWVQSGRAGGTRANLRGANLCDADLRGANLRGANLRGANLCGANLCDADLRGANLCGANLCGANLRGANLCGANLCGANLCGANLRGANLCDADLRGANLCGANLCGANLRGAKLPAFSHCPQEGEFIAFKKLSGGVVAKLKIPAGASRTSSLVGRKCRAEFVEVLELPDGVQRARSSHDSAVVYVVGETVRPDSYDPDIRIECTHGIHFYISREEAEAY